jgi:hypothetical protein
MARLDLGALVGSQTMREPTFSNPYSETVYKFMNKQYDVQKEASKNILDFEDRERDYAAKNREEARLLEDREKEANTSAVIDALVSGRISSPDQLGITNYNAKAVAEYMDTANYHKAVADHYNNSDKLDEEKFGFNKEKYYTKLKMQEEERRRIAANRAKVLNDAMANKRKQEELRANVDRLAASSSLEALKQVENDAAKVGDTEAVKMAQLAMRRKLELNAPIPKSKEQLEIEQDGHNSQVAILAADNSHDELVAGLNKAMANGNTKQMQIYREAILKQQDVNKLTGKDKADAELKQSEAEKKQKEYNAEILSRATKAKNRDELVQGFLVASRNKNTEEAKKWKDAIKAYDGLDEFTGKSKNEAKQKLEKFNKYALLLGANADIDSINEVYRHAAKIGDMKTLALAEKAKKLYYEIYKATGDSNPRNKGTITPEAQYSKSKENLEKAPSMIREIFSSRTGTEKVQKMLHSLHVTDTDGGLTFSRSNTTDYLKEKLIAEYGNTAILRRIIREYIEPFSNNVLNGDTDTTTLGGIEYNSFLKGIALLDKVKADKKRGK